LGTWSKNYWADCEKVFLKSNFFGSEKVQVLFLEKSCGKMYTIFSAVQRQQRKSDVMTYFGLTARSAF
jgi:hypothetical protein